MKLRFVLCCLPLLAFAGNRYENKALNPVKFETPPVHAKLELVRNGKLNFAVVYDSHAERNEKMKQRQSLRIAVGAVCDAFERTTGVRPPVLDADSPDLKNYPYWIVIGKNKITDRLGLDPLKLPPNAFLVKTFPKGIVIAGHDGSLIPGSYNPMDWYRYRINGTAYGAYDFLERVLGMRYYYPGIGVYVPGITDLTVEPVSYADKPEFKTRYHWAYLNFSKANWPWKDLKYDAEEFDHAMRMGKSSRAAISHTPPPSGMGKAFPDKIKTMFYTDKSGYTYYNPSTHIGNMYDISNPELADILVGAWKKYYDTDGKWNIPWHEGKRIWYPPNSEYVMFGQADTLLAVENEQAKKWISAKDPERQTDLYLNFYIQLAERLKKILPDKKLLVFFYHKYTKPPLIIKSVPDNMEAMLCNTRIIYIKSPEVKKSVIQLFQDWHTIFKRPLDSYCYGEEENAFTRAVQGRYMKEYIHTISPWLSRESFFYDSGTMPQAFYYSYYPVYRVLWNPEFNQDAALEEHWNLLYGPKAGAALKEFYGILVSRWESYAIPKVGIKRVTDDILYKEAYPPAVIARLEKLLKTALDATAPGSIERRRVEFFAKPWEKEFSTAKAYSNFTIPFYSAKKLASGEQIKIDGKIAESAWNRAEQMRMQDARENGNVLPSSPDIRMLWSPEGIYLAAVVHGAPTVNKGDVFFKTDTLEIFLSPGLTKSEYFQFAFAPGGDFFDAWRRLLPIEAALDDKWECIGLKHAVNVQKDKWTLEAFIPFSGLKVEPPKTYQCWFVNVVNTKKNPAEYSSFSLTMGNNHNISLYGKMKFLGNGD